MLQRLRHTSIKQRLYLVLAMVIAGLVFVGWLTYVNARDNLMAGKQASTRNVVDAVRHVVERFHAEAERGNMSEEEAKRRALQVIESIRYDNSEYVWVNDYRPRMVMHPIKPELNGTSLVEFKDPHGTYLFREMVNVVRSDNAGFVAYYWPKPGHEQPVRKLSYVAGYEPWRWIIGSGIYIDDMEAELTQQTLAMAGIIGAIMATVLGILAAIAGSITQPLQHTVTRLRDIASGDGDLTAHLIEEGDDELSVLATQFNTFVDKIRTLVVNAGTSIVQLATASEELTAATDRTAATMQKQRSETEQLASAMNEMTATALEIAKSAEQASERAVDAAQEARNSRNIVTQTLQVVDELSAEMDQTTRTIDRLKTETENIGAVLTVIQGIAEQTNLLALNAAIEAARAGDQGRGFAVVADEVRALASKTQQSTQEINDMIAKLQTGASNAVNAMRQSLQKTKGSVEAAHRAEKALDTVSTAIGIINDMNAQIAAASEEQSLVAEEINRNVTNIATLADANTASAQQVLSSSQNVRTVGDTLRGQVKQFRV